MRLLFGIVALAFLTGCDDAVDLVKERMEKGTNIGVASCLSRNSDVGMRPNLVEKLCRRKHERPIIVNLDGKAGYSSPTVFAGTVANKSDNVIVTGFKVRVMHEDNKDEQGQRKSDEFEVKDLWLLPGDTHRFKSDKLAFHPTAERYRIDKDGKFTFDWSTFAELGVSIELR